MSAELEIEVTYLAAAMPDLTSCKHKEMRDIYFPADMKHPKLRLRQKEDSFEFTKKTQADPNDAGNQHEENVSITKEEFNALAQGNGRSLSKTRYYLPYHGLTAEVDIFHEDLQGLVVIEFEFSSRQEKAEFEIPDFCLVDVTQEEFIAGGMLAGKKYEDIRAQLEQFGYKPL